MGEPMAGLGGESGRLSDDQSRTGSAMESSSVISAMS